MRRLLAWLVSLAGAVVLTLVWEAGRPPTGALVFAALLFGVLALLVMVGDEQQRP